MLKNLNTNTYYHEDCYKEDEEYGDIPKKVIQKKHDYRIMAGKLGFRDSEVYYDNGGCEALEFIINRYDEGEDEKVDEILFFIPDYDEWKKPSIEFLKNTDGMGWELALNVEVKDKPDMVKQLLSNLISQDIDTPEKFRDFCKNNKLKIEEYD